MSEKARTVKLIDVSAPEVVVELLDACSECGADLRADGSLREINLNDVDFLVTVSDDGEVEVGPKGWYGETWYVIAYLCAGCGTDATKTSTSLGMSDCGGAA